MKDRKTPRSASSNYKNKRRKNLGRLPSHEPTKNATDNLEGVTVLKTILTGTKRRHNNGSK